MNDPIYLLMGNGGHQVLLVYKTVIYLPAISDEVYVEGITYTVVKRKFIYNAVGTVNKVILKVKPCKKP